MSHSTKRNMSSVQQSVASVEKEHTFTYADGPQHREEEGGKKRLPATTVTIIYSMGLGLGSCHANYKLRSGDC